MDQLAQPLSSVSPSDSVSQTAPKKNSRPGKNGRNANRLASSAPVSTVSVTQPSVSKADSFAASARSAPTPQPGNFPVVFSTGAGEPTTDCFFSLAPKTINDNIGNLNKLLMWA